LSSKIAHCSNTESRPFRFVSGSGKFVFALEICPIRKAGDKSKKIGGRVGKKGVVGSNQALSYGSALEIVGKFLVSLPRKRVIMVFPAWMRASNSSAKSPRNRWLREYNNNDEAFIATLI
jgi:hypothetical protein